MKFRATTMSVLFAVFGLNLAAQQIVEGCSRHYSVRRQTIPAVCRPALSESQRQSLDLPRNNDDAIYVSFDVPGAANGTYTQAINDSAATTGYFIDAADNVHGFVRDWFGHITSFDVPGDGGGTASLAINNVGTTGGNWCPDTTYTHCPAFLRDAWGNITSFDPPGEYYGASVYALNAKGVATGDYFDVNSVIHGFVRASDGTLTEFDAPGATWTWPLAIGADGTIAGSFLDGNGWHGFLRDRSGNLSTFDVPGYTDTGEGAFYGGPAISMNAVGEIAGSYVQTANTYDGFLRHRDGMFDTFYAADYSPCCIWTFPTAVNSDRTIAGYDNDGYDINHGFVRTPDGQVTLFDAPGAGTGDFQGTVVVGMTAGRVIAGFYIDSGGLNHGFLRIPH